MRVKKITSIVLIILYSLILYGCGSGTDELPVYQLNIVNNGQGTVIKTPNQESYKKGTEVTIEAIPAMGWHFSHWSGDLVGSDNPHPVVLNKNLTIAAHFVDNLPPQIEPIEDITTYQYEEITFSVRATDPDGDELTYRATGDLTTCFNEDSRTFSWTPGYGTAGEYTITFKVSDGIHTSTEIVNIEVIWADGKPVIEKFTDQEIYETEPLYFRVRITDPDGDDFDVSVSGDLKDKFNLASLEFNWTPVEGDAGQYTLTLTVKQNESVIVEKTIEIKVLVYNHPPEFELETAYTINENENLTFTVTASDADGDELTYSASGDLAEYFDPDTKTFNWTPGYDAAGEHILTITVSDTDKSTSKDCIITVKNVNRVPVFELPQLMTAEETVPLTFEVTATDPDGEPLTYSVNGDLAEFYDPLTKIFFWTPQIGEAGNIYHITLSASDGIDTTEHLIEIQVSVYIPDDNLEAAIRETISKYEGMLSQTDLLQINALDAREYSISNLEGIQHLSNLVWVELDNNNISDIGSLSTLVNLQSIFLRNNNISSINSLPLNNVSINTNLREIYLSGNNVSDISFLSNFHALKIIEADNNYISAVCDLSNMTNLNSLSLQNNMINDISLMANAPTSITQLYLNNNQITEITSLKHLVNLDILDLSYNPITSIDDLFDMYKLRELNLDGTLLANIHVLQYLNNLQKVYLRNCTNLDLSEGSEASQIIEYLRSKGVSVVTD